MSKEAFLGLLQQLELVLCPLVIFNFSKPCTIQIKISISTTQKDLDKTKPKFFEQDVDNLPFLVTKG